MDGQKLSSVPLPHSFFNVVACFIKISKFAKETKVTIIYHLIMELISHYLCLFYWWEARLVQFRHLEAVRSKLVSRTIFSLVPLAGTLGKTQPGWLAHRLGQEVGVLLPTVAIGRAGNPMPDTSPTACAEIQVSKWVIKYRTGTDIKAKSRGKWRRWRIRQEVIQVILEVSDWHLFTYPQVSFA